MEYLTLGSLWRVLVCNNDLGRRQVAFKVYILRSVDLYRSHAAQIGRHQVRRTQTASIPATIFALSANIREIVTTTSFVARCFAQTHFP